MNRTKISIFLTVEYKNFTEVGGNSQFTKTNKNISNIDKLA